MCLLKRLWEEGPGVSSRSRATDVNSLQGAELGAVATAFPENGQEPPAGRSVSLSQV